MLQLLTTTRKPGMPPKMFHQTGQPKSALTFADKGILAHARVSHAGASNDRRDFSQQGRANRFIGWVVDAHQPFAGSW